MAPIGAFNQKSSMKNSISLISIVIVFVFITSCNGCGKKDPVNVVVNDTIPKVTVPDFNADSAYSFIQRQVDFGPRVMGSKAHENCAIYLTEQFRKYSNDITVQQGSVQTFDGKTFPIKNIVASFNPSNANRIFICSHWDSRPFADYDPDEKNHTKAIDGANDGASGVGIIIEIARILSANKITLGVDLILFDAEDYGQPEKSSFPPKEDTWALGSQYWSKKPHKENYNARFGILLDMVGAANATFYMEGFSQYYAPDVVRKVWSAAARSGYSDFFINENSNEITDDHYYINNIIKIPTIDIIQHDMSSPTGFYKNWHTTHDDLKGIDKATLKAVGQTLLRVIFEEQ